MMPRDDRMPSAERLTSINYNPHEVFKLFNMLDDAKFRCERHIADLTLPIATLKENSPREGTGLLAAAELIEQLQQTLDRWQQRKKALTEHSGRR
jgi:hypothetical protein